MQPSLNASRILVLSPADRFGERVALAACRNGAVGIVDAAPASRQAAVASVAAVRAGARPGDLFGVRLEGSAAANLPPAFGDVPVALLACVAAERLPGAVARARGRARFVLCEAHDVDGARAAEAAGADGVLVKGTEAGGFTGTQSAFILLQRLAGRLARPWWVQGGMGLHAAAAARMAGAGVALCEQLWLTEEAGLPAAERAVWRGLDGSETTAVGRGARVFRCFARTAPGQIRKVARQAEAGAAWEALVRAPEAPLCALGQDVAFAGPLAARHPTVAAVLAAYRAAPRAHVEVACAAGALAPGAPLAREHGTRIPVVQGPMTRVSDGVAFARAVAQGGGLPFLALAVMRPPAIRRLLGAAHTELEGTSWGAGLLGFLPPEQLEPQLEAVFEAPPPFALLAGGTPALARRLEARGTPAYLHAPSPALLRLFLRQGHRRFVLEGSECGGHTGPRTSLVLWDQAVDALLEEAPETLTAVRLLFAGGIHDALSAAMVAALAAPVVERGARMGVLMGSAYLFTEEVVGTGALLPEFQARALVCEQTALLEAGPGYTTRCAQTPFVDAFAAERQVLHDAGRPEEEVLWTLERLAVGRLRIAAKGVARAAADAASPVSVPVARQRRDGLYMLGDVATLRSRTTTVARLHEDVSAGAVRRLAACAAPPAVPQGEDRDVAVVGMACLFPGGPDLRAFWRHVVEGRSAVREVDPARWRPADHFNPDRRDPNGIYARWGCFVEETLFDPTQHGIAPVSMPSIEPLQLLAVEVARRAVEDADQSGVPVPRGETAVVFASGGVGDRQADYVFRTELQGFVSRVEGLDAEARRRVLDALEREVPPWTEDAFPGTLVSVVAGRVANRLDLRGGNFVVDAACASSLAALQVGVETLRAGRADCVLVGAADGSNNAVGFMAFSRTQALSPTGRSHPFDDAADGLVMGEGVAALVLKRRADAERDGNHVYALVKGVGSSSDGRTQSLVAPHADGQVAALRRAYADARLAPTTVGLVEAHGTGTPRGDPTEVEAIARVFGRPGPEGPRCAIGSVKSSIGHTKTAAGLAGLVKGALALHQRVLPPTVGVETPNRRIDFAQAPVYLNTVSRPWLRTGDGPRRCGVSAFGFGGTNVHAVLEEAPRRAGAARPPDLAPRPVEVLALARADRAALREAVDALRSRLAHPETLDLAAFCAAVHAAQTARESGPERLAVVARSGPDLARKLDAARDALAGSGPVDAAGVHHGTRGAPDGATAFLFPGQGAQRVGMLRDVMTAVPAARRLLEQADARLARALCGRLSDRLDPPPAFTDAERRRQRDALDRTEVAQPALGVVDLAAFDVLERHGLRPDAVAGHSFGEYAALAAAGVLDRLHLLDLAAARGRLVAEATADAPGTLASAALGAEALRRLLGGLQRPVEIANLNAPEQTVFGGPTEAVEAAVAALTAEGVCARTIPVAAPFHTSAMQGAAVRLAAVLAEVPFAAPRLPVYSNTLGTRFPDAPGAIRELLGAHVRRPVRFQAQVEAMYSDGVRTFVECGPGTVLGGLVGQILAGRPHRVLAFDVPGRPGLAQLAHLLAQAFALGFPVDLGPWFAGRFEAAPRLDAVLAEARGRAAPEPTAWRVDMGRVRPADAPADVRETAAGAAARAAAASPAEPRVLLRPRRVRPTRVETPAEAAPAPGAGNDAPDVRDFQSALLAAASERTGYPVSMLALDAHMEAELGIDSIKRMEILGAMTEFARVLDDPESGARLAEISRLRTLQSIVDWFEAHRAEHTTGNGAAPAAGTAARPAPAESDAVHRYAVRAVPRPAPPGEAGLRVPEDGLVLVVGTPPALGSGVTATLEAAGHHVAWVRCGNGPGAGGAGYAVDPGSTTSLAALRDLLHRARDRRVAAIVHLAAAEPDRPAEAAAAELFLLLQVFEEDLCRPGLERARVVVVTALGGRLGLDGAAPVAAAARAGVRGVAKSAAREWPGVAFQLIDVDPGLDAPMALAAVLGEIERADVPLEAGLSAGGRVEPALVEAPVPGPAQGPAQEGALPLTADAVVLVTGGASGITAAVAVELARRTRCHLVLVGRSAAPGPEPAALAACSDAQALRDHLLRDAQAADAAPTPAALEARVARVLKDRAIRRTLDAARAAGARVTYRTLDVRDAAAFTALLDEVQATHGRLDGVIHGAGALDDRRLCDKPLASFQAVFETKVRPAQVLAERLRPEGLGFLLFFSSVAGRLGNAGQCDYSAANEALNALAASLARAWPAVHVEAIAWGPWDGGMVDEALRRRYAAAGVHPIPLEEGVARCLAEIAGGRGPDAEVVVTASLAALERGPAPAEAVPS